MGDGGWRNKIETGGYGESKGIEFLLQKKEIKGYLESYELNLINCITEIDVALYSACYWIKHKVHGIS